MPLIDIFRMTIALFCAICTQSNIYILDPPQPGFIGSIQQEVHAKTPGLYQVPKLRNLNFCFCTVCFGGGVSPTTWDHQGDPGGGPRENPKSLSSPKAEKYYLTNADKIVFMTLRFMRLGRYPLGDLASTCIPSHFNILVK